MEKGNKIIYIFCMIIVLCGVSVYAETNSFSSTGVTLDTTLYLPFWTFSSVYGHLVGSEESNVYANEFISQERVIDIRHPYYGAVCDWVTDDTTAIQSAIDDAKEGDIIYFSRGGCMISSPLIVNKTLSFKGQNKQYSAIKAMDGFTGDYMLRNWYDSDYGVESTKYAPDTTANPAYWIFIEDLMFDLGHEENVNAIGWVHYQDMSYISNVNFRGANNSRAISLFANSDTYGSVDGGTINKIMLMGGNWSTELYVNLSNNDGTDLHISDWVSAQNGHEASPFYFNSIGDLTMDNMHVEAYPFPSLSAKDYAVYRLENCRSSSITESLFSEGSAVTLEHPIIHATNDADAGYIASPIIIKFEVLKGFTSNAPFMIDESEPFRENTIEWGNPNNLTQVKYYDGNRIDWYTQNSKKSYSKIFTDLTFANLGVRVKNLSLSSTMALNYAGISNDGGTSTAMKIDNSGNMTVIGTVTCTDVIASGDIYTPRYVKHTGDEDTFWEFQVDKAYLKVGNEYFISVVESTQDSIKIGYGGDSDLNFNDIINISGSDPDLNTGGNAGANLCIDANGNLCKCGTCA